MPSEEIRKLRKKNEKLKEENEKLKQAIVNTAKDGADIATKIWLSKRDGCKPISRNYYKR